MDSDSLILKLTMAAFLAPAISGVAIWAKLATHPIPAYSQEGARIAGAQPHTVARRDRNAARRLYDRVMEEFHHKDYEAALAGFRLFMILHGDSSLAASAQYWIGECEFRLRRYQEAIEAFSKAALVSQQGQKQAAATIKIGLAYSKLGQAEAARIMLERVVVEFQNTPEATVAEKYLNRLGGQDTPATPVGTQEEPAYQVIDSSQASINGIHVGSSEDEIISALGAPLATEAGFDEPTAARSKTLVYDGVKIYVVEGELYTLSCRSKRCITADGVNVGATKGKVLSTYGQGQPQRPDAEGESLSYRIKGMDAALVFHLREGLVEQIELLLNDV